MRILNCILVLVAGALLPVASFAQGGGFGGGGGGAGAAYQSFQNQSPAAHQSATANSSELIAVKGSAEISVKPESLRLVFAVTAEAKESIQCSEQVDTAIKTIREALQPLKLTGDRVVEDFIVVMPSYKWDLEEREERKVLRELHDGFRMQSNLHVLCDDEEQAMAVIDEAFKAGVSEIISFDYFHSDLDRYKREVLKKALDEAKSKSEILLSIFEDKPKVLNVGDSSSVSFPQSQYKTIAPTPDNSQAVLPYSWRDYLKIKAHRPKTTYYAGSKEFSDFGLKKPPMNPEIIVQSTVTLTYGSPARGERIEIEKIKAANATNRSGD